MTTMGCEEQSGAETERVKGDETVAPLVGLLTVMLANAGQMSKENSETQKKSLRSAFMGEHLGQDVGVHTDFIPTLQAARRGVWRRFAGGEPGRIRGTPESARDAVRARRRGIRFQPLVAALTHRWGRRGKLFLGPRARKLRISVGTKVIGAKCSLRKGRFVTRR